ncbi:MAG: hypothetical protein WCY98_07075 [Castellaniella sp.]
MRWQPTWKHDLPWAGVGAWLVLASPPLRSWLEASMVMHMLVQMPLLLVLGMRMPHWLPERIRARLLSVMGGPGVAVLVSVFVLTYWMLPRALDAALSEPVYEAAKFLGLSLLAGLPLALAWPFLGVLGRGFFLSNMASMLAAVGWLYIAAPVRICNQYLVDDQTRAGWWMIIVALALFLWWMAGLFRGSVAGHPGRIKT